MRSILHALLAYSLTPWGLVLLGALDSSIVFFLPLGIDVAVIILAARQPDLFWLYAILATAGTVMGTGGTFWIGRKAGEHGLSFLLKPARRKRIAQRVSQRAAVSVAALAIVPPPFPFTAFALTSGAFGVNPWNFFAGLAGFRLLRFLVESALAARYGNGILSWMDSPIFIVFVGVIIALAVIGTVLSAIAVYRGTRRVGVGSSSRH